MANATDEYVDAEIVDDPPKSTNGGGSKQSPKPAPADIIDAEVIPDQTTGEKVRNAVGLPKDEFGKLKSEPWQGVKGLYKAQWMVAPNALSAAVAVPSVYKAGAEAAAQAAKQSGATDATVKAAKQAAKDAAKLAAEHSVKGTVAKGIGHFIPFIGSAIAVYSAIDDFKNGRIVSGALNVLGVIPGPVGWTAMGAAMIWNAFDDSGIGEWEKPDGTEVHILQGSAKDISGVKELDAKIREAQAAVFSFQDGPTGSVWNSSPPAAVRIDGQATTRSVSTLGAGLGVLDKATGTAGTEDIKAMVTAYFNGLSDHFAAIEKVMVDSGESYFAEQRTAMAPTFAAMSKLRDLAAPLMTQLTAASDGAAVAYQAVLDANAAARKQLSDDGKLSDSGAATTMATKMSQGASQIRAANAKIEQLVPATPVPVLAARTGSAPTGTRPAETKPQEQKPTPAPVTPSLATAPQATPAKTETPTKTDDTLSKLLSQLGQQNKAPTATNPLGNTGTGGLGGGSPLGSQGLGGGQGGGTPLSQSKPDTSTKSEPKKLVDDKPERKTTTEPKKLDDKSLSGSKPEQARSAVPTPEKPATAPVTPAAAQAPATGPTPAQQNSAAAAKDAKPNTEVDVKGQKTAFPDAKTAKLAELLSKADPTHPVSLADAAKSAGLTPPVPGQDPGRQVSPADAKPGDLLVTADKNYMLLGDGKFYDLADYKVVSASEIPQNLGDRAGYFHLVDPAPGAPGPQAAPGAPQGPVSPQSTAGVQFQVPGATDAPTGPQAAPAPGGVPNVGSPGVPKPAPAAAGPANAASTDTGVGGGGTTTGGKPLDPSAVR